MPNSYSTIAKSPELSEISAKLVTTSVDIHAMQSLRYHSYLAAGYLAPDEATIFSDQYDGEATSLSILIFHNDVAAASVRVCLLDPSIKDGPGSSIPATTMFNSEIREYMEKISDKIATPRAVEITRLSRHPEYSRSTGLVMAMFNLIGYIVIKFEAHAMYAAVTKEHIPFYKRMGFNLIGAPKRYLGLNVDTALLGCLSTEHRGIKGMTVALPDMSASDPQYEQLISGKKFNVSSPHYTSGNAKRLPNRLV